MYISFHRINFWSFMMSSDLFRGYYVIARITLFGKTAFP